MGKAVVSFSTRVMAEWTCHQGIRRTRDGAYTELNERACLSHAFAIAEHFLTAGLASSRGMRQLRLTLLMRYRRTFAALLHRHNRHVDHGSVTMALLRCHA